MRLSQGERIDPRTLGARCDECPLNGKRLSGRHVVPDHVIFPKKKALVVLGESPGPTEQLTNEFFAGESGALQSRVFDSQRIDPSSVHVTNVLLCKLDRLSPSETSEAISCCSPRLHREIDRDSVVLAYGNVTLEALTGRKPKISRVWGPSLTSEVYGCKYVASFHPAYVLRNPAAKPLLDVMVNRWQQLANGQLSFTWPKQIIEPGEEMLRSLRSLSGPLALDVETMGQQAIESEIICVGLSSLTDNVSICVPWKTTTDGADTLVEAGDEIKALTREIVSKHSIIAHNLQYDWINTRYMGGFQNHRDWNDTMLARHVVSPFLPKNLEDTSATYFPMERWKTAFRGARDKGGLAAFVNANPVKRAVYNCKDSWMTALLWPRLQRDLERTHNGHRLYQSDLSQTWLAIEMHERGVGLSLDDVHKHASEFSSKLSSQEEAIRLVAGDEFNPRSPRQIALKFASYGLTSKRKTPSGQPSYTEEILGEIASKSHNSEAATLAARILKMRKVKKLYGYVAGGDKSTERPLVDYKPSEVLRPDWQPWGTRTGRWSVSGYPLMMIPQPKYDINKNIVSPGLWDMFTATRPGCTLAKFDYSQLELRILALLSGDKKLLQWYAEGKDVHRENAIRLFGVTDPTPHQRTLAKNTVYGANYQLHNDPNAARAIWAIIVADFPNIGLADVARVLKAWFEDHLEICSWQDAMVAQASKLGYVDAPLSGRRHYHYGKLNPNQVLNEPIQDSAAEVMRRASLRVRGRLEGDEAIVMQIHDELVIEGPDEDRLVRILSEEMPERVTLNGNTMVFGGDIGVGFNKGKMRKILGP